MCYYDIKLTHTAFIKSDFICATMVYKNKGFNLHHLIEI